MDTVERYTESSEKNKLKILLVEPKKLPCLIEIDDTIEAMQELVGGYIEEYMPFEDDVAIICNEDGKMLSLELNRAVYADDKKQKILDIIAGKFFVCYAPVESEKFLSLPDNLAQKYEKLFKYPERFFKQGKDIIAMPYYPSLTELER